MEGDRDYGRLVRRVHRESQEGQQATHLYNLGTPLSTQMRSLWRLTSCPCSSRRSPSTSRSSGRGTSRSTLVLLQLAGGNKFGDEGCRAIAEADLPRLQILHLGMQLSTQAVTASAPEGASTFRRESGTAYRSSRWVTLPSQRRQQDRGRRLQAAQQDAAGPVHPSLPL
jgi:hypothetical protein